MRYLTAGTLTAILIALAAFSQDKPILPAKADAKPMLAKAAEMSDLVGLGMNPFHIRMKTKSYISGNKVLEGSYDLWLAATFSWREEITWAGVKFSRIVQGNQQWIEGEDTHRVDTDRMREVTTISGFLSSISNRQVSHVNAKEVAGGPGVCFEFEQPPPRTAVSIEITGPGGASSGPLVNTIFPNLSVCMNLATGQAEEIDSDELRWEFTSYMPFAGKQFPRVLRKFKGKKVLVEAEVEMLEPFDVLKADVMTPASNAVSKEWCTKRTLPEPTRFEGDTSRAALTLLPSGRLINLPNGFAHVGFAYFSVDENGHVTDVKGYSLGRENSMTDSEKRILLKTVFIPAKCQGRPIAGEYVLHFPEDRDPWP